MIGGDTVSMDRVQTLTIILSLSIEEISRSAALKIVVVVDSDGVRSGGDEEIVIREGKHVTGCLVPCQLLRTDSSD